MPYFFNTMSFNTVNSYNGYNNYCSSSIHQRLGYNPSRAAGVNWRTPVPSPRITIVRPASAPPCDGAEPVTPPPANDFCQPPLSDFQLPTRWHNDQPPRGTWCPPTTSLIESVDTQLRSGATRQAGRPVLMPVPARPLTEAERKVFRTIEPYEGPPPRPIQPVAQPLPENVRVLTGFPRHDRPEDPTVQVPFHIDPGLVEFLQTHPGSYVVATIETPRGDYKEVARPGLFDDFIIVPVAVFRKLIDCNVYSANSFGAIRVTLKVHFLNN